jgi:excisionase family DNA binding protein
MSTETFVTIGDAARYLGVSPATIVRMFDEGLLHGHVLPSGHRRIARDSVEMALRPQPGRDYTPEGVTDGTPGYTDPEGEE